MLQHIFIETYYTQKAIDFGLTPPTFDHSKPSSKTILADKIEKIDYTFQINLIT
jgi:hypothetical protein